MGHSSRGTGCEKHRHVPLKNPNGRGHTVTNEGDDIKMDLIQDLNWIHLAWVRD
jgi:hypothetical protein